MTWDERWGARYNEVMDFMEENHRNPLRHRIEVHDWGNGGRGLKALSHLEKSLYLHNVSRLRRGE